MLPSLHLFKEFRDLKWLNQGAVGGIFAAGSHLLAVALIAAIVGGVFWYFYKSDLADGIPISYDGDAYAVLASIKAAGERGLAPLAPREIPALGVPDRAVWSDIPFSEFVFWFPSFLVPLFGVVGSANLAVLISLVLAGWAFYFCAVALGAGKIPSCVAGILFSLSPYGFVRNSEHLMLTMYFVVPVFIYCAWRLWGHDLIKLSVRNLLVLGFLAMGCSLFMPYYWAMFLVLLAVVTLGHMMNHSWKGVIFCAFVAAMAVIGFALQNIDTLIYRAVEGPNPTAVSRDLWWMVKFGLYLPDLILPKFHNLPLMEFLSGKDYHWKIPEQIQGESQTAYMGMAAVIGLGLLLIRSFGIAFAGKSPDQPALFWFALTVFCFAVVGGLNYLLGAFGFQFLRASNRYSIFLAAIGLLYLAILLTKLKARPILLIGICIPILALGIYDQVPKIPDWLRAQRRQAVERFVLDREFFPEMEKRLPPGTMVFQFPAHGFPEMGPVLAMGDYEHFRPYLHTNNLRFSYGGVKGRKGFQWQEALDENAPAEILSQLQDRGFVNVLINRRAYPDQGEELKSRLIGAGMRELMGNRDFILLEIHSARG